MHETDHIKNLCILYETKNIPQYTIKDQNSVNTLEVEHDSSFNIITFIFFLITVFHTNFSP